MVFSLECEMEDDGRWIAEVPDLPGVSAYGGSKIITRHHEMLRNYPGTNAYSIRMPFGSRKHRAQ